MSEGRAGAGAKLTRAKKGMQTVRCKMVDGLERRGLSATFMELFPFEEVVRAGLRSPSEFWSGLALNWALFVPRSQGLKQELDALSATGETQQIRHAARKIARRLNAS